MEGLGVMNGRRLALRMAAALLAIAICHGMGAAATAAAAGGAAQQSESLEQLRKEVAQALAEIQALQTKVNSSAPQPAAKAQLQRELNDERARIESLETRLDRLAASGEASPAAPSGATAMAASAAGQPAPAAPASTAAPATLASATDPQKFQAGRGQEVTPGLTTGLAPADIYNNGFFLRTQDDSFSIFFNGLFQTRFTYFKPGASVAQFGASPSSDANFDVYLGRLAASGSVFSPTLKYFLQFQGSTAGNGNGVTLLDWFTSKTFSKYLTLQAGRFWTPYTYEYYDSPGNYLFADLSTAEFAFVLPRALGVEAYGQVGRLSYAGVISNSIPALDAPGIEDFGGRVAYIGNVHYDILAPYGYIETEPSKSPVRRPELTLWASGAYNPVSGASSFENVAAGDKTVNATSTAGFRYGFLSLQTTGYYRRTTPVGLLPPDNSWGYAEQAGYYIIPSRLELAERVSGVNWGAPHFLGSDFAVNTWYSGPNFPYHNITEHSIGLNYYLYGHHAKLQLSYSYLTGDTFSRSTFNGNRIWVQSQIMF